MKECFCFFGNIIEVIGLKRALNEGSMMKRGKNLL